MKKTTVDFIWVAPSIYHSFFFLDLPLVMSDGVPVWCQAVFWRLPGIYHLWLTPSVVSLVTWQSAVQFKHHRVGKSNSCGQGYCFSSRWYLNMRDDSGPGFWWLLSQFFPPKASIPSHSSSISSLLCPSSNLPESRIIDCIWNLCVGPLNGSLHL